MMNFYYDPIRGLQYDYLGATIIMDIAVLPDDLNVENILKLLNQKGVEWFTSTYPQTQIIGEITNYIL